jgi:hypothetical protein
MMDVKRRMRQKLRLPFYMAGLLVLVITGVLAVSPAVMQAQVLTNNGATVKTEGGAIVYIEGSMLNSSGTYDNTGTTTIRGHCTNNGTIGDTGSIFVSGDWINNSTFNRGLGIVILNGTSAESFGGSAITTFHNLKVDSGGAKNFNQSEIVDDTMDFHNGVCFTSQTNLLTFTTNGNWIEAAPASYVNGPCGKNFNSTTEWRYPIGKKLWSDAVARVNTVGVKPSASTASTFRCEYFDSSFSNTTSLDTVTGDTLFLVSNRQFWHIDQTSSTPYINAAVRLYWITGDYPPNSITSNPLRLTVVQWNGTRWKDRGQAAVNGNYDAGNILSKVDTQWGLLPNECFTIGDTDEPGLPVELDHFAAMQVGDHVQLEWLTRSEIENLGFEVERRAASEASPELVQSWRTNPDLRGKSTYGADYLTQDVPPADGEYRYDLYQRDMDGARWHVGTETLLYKHVPQDAPMTLDLFPNPATENTSQLRIGAQNATTNLRLEVVDATGRTLYDAQLGSISAGYQNFLLPGLAKLASGSYQVRILGGSQIATKTLLITH